MYYPSLQIILFIETISDMGLNCNEAALCGKQSKLIVELNREKKTLHLSFNYLINTLSPNLRRLPGYSGSRVYQLAL